MPRPSSLAVFIVLLISAPLLFAQRGVSGGMPAGMGHVGIAGATGHPVPAVVHGSRPNGPRGVHPGPNSQPFRGVVSYPYGFGYGNGYGYGSMFLGAPIWDSGYWDDGEQMVYEPPPPQEQQPATEPQLMPVREPARHSAQPLIIELQGDRYVRIGGQNQAAAAPQVYAQAPPSRVVGKTVAPALPSVVLAFRDGTREEVDSYTIIGNTLYESGDYWTQGYWTKKVQLADLDLPETIRLNLERGVPFKLPTAPNDIITRP